jgi:hypothetical protein
MGRFFESIPGDGEFTGSSFESASFYLTHLRSDESLSILSTISIPLARIEKGPGEIVASKLFDIAVFTLRDLAL